jgi:hypothetical protein
MGSEGGTPSLEDGIAIDGGHVPTTLAAVITSPHPTTPTSHSPSPKEVKLDS